MSTLGNDTEISMTDFSNDTLCHSNYKGNQHRPKTVTVGVTHPEVIVAPEVRM